MAKKAKDTSAVDALTIAREGDDRMAPRRELHQHALTRGAWATVVYAAEELNRPKEEVVRPTLPRHLYR